MRQLLQTHDVKQEMGPRRTEKGKFLHLEQEKVQNMNVSQKNEQKLNN